MYCACVVYFNVYTCTLQATLRAVRVSMSLLRGLRSLKGAANGSTSSNGSLEDGEVFDDDTKKT